MRKLFAVLALLTCASATFAQHMATTTIADALYNPDGSPASGEIIIRANQTFRTADGYTVVAGTKYFANLGTGGTFSIAIAPTTTATPAGSSYTAVYVTALSETTQLWIVPPSSSPLNLSQVQIAPAATLFPFSSIVPPLNCVSLGGVIQYTTSGYTCISTAITSISESQVTGLAASLAGLVSTATTVNGHPLTGNVTISASDLTTGTLGAWLFPGLSGDVTSPAGSIATTVSGIRGAPVPALATGYLYYNGSALAWIAPSIPVTSVFGRTGVVVPTSGDYSFSQIGGTLGSSQFPTLTGDISNTGFATTVVALRGAYLSLPSTGYLYYNGSAYVWQTPPGTVAVSGTPASGQLAAWSNATTIQGTTYLPSGNFPQLTGDLSGTAGSLSVTVGGLKGSALPALSNGYLLWTGSAWAFSSPTGGVTSVGLTAPSWFTVSSSPVTGSGTIAITAATGQSSHQVIGTCGSATSFGPCALVAADLPTISLSTGVSGTLQSAQFPTLTGDMTNTGLATTLSAIRGVSLPLPSAGYLFYNGSAFAWQTPSGGGNISNSGTPTGGQLAVWVNSTAIQGVSALPTAAVPAFTGDVTNTAGSLATTVGAIKNVGVPALSVGYLYYNGSAFAWQTPTGGAGSVTSVGLSAPSWFTVSSSPITTSGTIAIAAATGQTSHQVIGTCGSAATFGPCALVAGDLPMISLSTGVSGTLQAAQEPAHTGDVTNSAGSLAMTVGAIKGVTVPTLAAGYLYYNGSTFAFQTPSGGGNVTNSGTPTSGQLATWVSSTGIQGVTTLPTAAMPPLSGDLNGTSGSLSVTVSGLKGIAVPAPTAGWLYYSGSTYSWSTPVAVTSVGLATPSWLAVTGSPVTTTGTLTIAAATGQTSHQVIGTCGSAATFGPCALVAGDLPTVSLTSGVSGTLQAAQEPAHTGDVTNSAGSLAMTVGAIKGVTVPTLAAGYLYYNGSTYVWQTPAGAGNVSNSGTPTSGQLAVWTASTTIQGLTTLPTAAVPAFTGDVTNTAGSLATTVGALEGHALPTLVMGYLQWTGSAWAFSSPGVGVTAWTSGALTSAANATLVTANSSTAASMTGPALANNVVFSLYNMGLGTVTYAPASGTLYGDGVVPQYAFAFQYTDNTNSYLLTMPTMLSFPNCTGALQFNSTTNVFSCGTGGSTPSSAGLAVWTGSAWGTSLSSTAPTFTGALTAASVATSGSTAGYLQLTAGTANAAAATSSILLQAPATATAYTVTLPGTIGTASQALVITGVSGSVATTSWSTVSSGGGNVTNSGTPTSGQLATWVSSTGIQGVTTLPTAAMPPLSGDLNGTSGSLSVTVSGLKGIAVPAPTAGWLYYSGSTYSWSTPVAVTSVGLATPSWLAVTGSPVTTTGTLTIAAATGQTSHQVIGTCGSAATFGPCALVAGDLPLSAMGTITGGTWTATAIAANYGGTGINTSGSNGVAQVASGTWSISNTLPSGLTATNLTLITPTLGVASATSLATTGSTAGYLQLTAGTANAAAASSSILLQAPATATAYSITLPAAIGTSNQTLQISSIASGVATLSWVTASGMTYPSGTGIAVVSGGASWGTTLTVGVGANNIPQLTSNSLLPAGITTEQWALGINANTLTASMVIYGPIPTAQAYTVPTNGTNSQATSQFLLGTLPTATWTATLYHIAASTAGCTGTSASMGTVAISTTGTQTWTLTQTSFAVGDCLKVVAPSSVDTTAAKPNLTLAVIK